MIFKTIGAIGLVFIIVGIVLRRRRIRDILYIIGGILLEIYSIYIGDMVFIILQAVFTVVAMYDLTKIKK